MIAGSILKCDPKNLATDLHKRISNLKIFENVEVAGPGFINITLKRIDFLSILNKIYEKNVTYGSSSLGERKKVQIEFVSANPTGPLHVGHGSRPLTRCSRTRRAFSAPRRVLERRLAERRPVARASREPRSRQGRRTTVRPPPRGAILPGRSEARRRAGARSARRTSRCARCSRPAPRRRCSRWTSPCPRS